MGFWGASGWKICGIATLAGLWLLTPNQAQAEPWISNRYAQNCAGCHAPGRLNLKASERRCTLSCQGCHVNPNGGGMRNRYGVWNQQRWLRSFALDFFGNKKAPEQLGKQPYWNPDGPSPHHERPLKFAEAKELNPSERNFSKFADPSWKTMAPSREAWLDRVPEGDPYREERDMPFTASGDFRYVYFHDYGEVTSSRQKDYGFLMGVDFGARARPTPKYSQFVFEGRTLNQPRNNGLEQGFTTESRIRSAYLLVDDLPYNSYVMYGLYRPMFGLNNPDHTSLSQTITGFTTRSLYKTFSIGTAPNVPFMNFNYVFRQANLSQDQSEGWVLNFGGRFVTMGASILFSIWNTDTYSNNQPLSRKMYSLSGGLTYWRIIWNFEANQIRREFSPGSADSGFVFTNIFMGRLWRELYLTLSYARANVATTLKEGFSKQAMFGFRGFFLPGTDVETLYVYTSSELHGSATSIERLLRMQFHLYF